MKRIIIIAAIALTAGFAKAASVNWQITNGTAAQVGYNVYLVAAIDSSWTGGADVAAAAAALGTGTSGTIAKNGRVYGIAATTASGDAITETSMKNAYLVLVQSDSAKEYTYISANLSASVFGDTDSAKDPFGATTAALLAGTSANFAAVPEPTSGLLMLLGFAGLALSRRRA